jgi:predicted GIY-YIG superfamily endonuclease
MPQLLLLADPRPLVERLGQEFFRQMSESPGVYLMRDATEQVLYVGKAKNLRKRLGSYRVANPDRLRRRHLVLLRAVSRIEIEECADELAALEREAELLRQLRPRFNRAGTWPGTPRFLLWRMTADGLEVAVTEAAEAPGLADGLSPAAPERETEVFALASLPIGKSRKQETLSAQPEARIPRRQVTLQMSATGGTSYGPLGAGVIPLRVALVRLLWSALHPQRGLEGMPGGWFQGQLPAVATIPRLQATVEEVETADHYLKALFASDWNVFSGWIGERIPGNRPFERTVRDADLETVAKVLRLKTTSPQTMTPRPGSRVLRNDLMNSSLWPWFESLASS